MDHRRGAAGQRREPDLSTRSLAAATRIRGLHPETDLGRRLDEAVGRAGAASARLFDRVAAAPDASHYLMTPRAVVTPRDAGEVGRILAFARSSGTPVTFRSGGTSLSGQALTEAVLVDTRKHFRDIRVHDDGERVTAQPGATVRQVNIRLARHGRRLGPDPASEIACTVGGVIANNSSGMTCGIVENSYRTIRSAVIVLPSGTIVDTAAPDADDRLRAAEPSLWQELHRLRSQLLAAPALLREVERQYSIKNTMGYGLNALADFDTAIEMLLHLIVGSEGTLGFVAEATFASVPDPRHASTALLLFSDIDAAAAAVAPIARSGALVIELLDEASLRAARGDAESAHHLPDTDAAALLVEYRAAWPDALERVVARASPLLAELPTLAPAKLTSDSTVRDALWHMRKGLFATIAGGRPPGTTALLEDIAVPLDELAPVCTQLTGLFERHGYRDAVIFGHAKDGNLHFMICEDFDEPESMERYSAFTEDLVDLVLGAGGSLKAEHGTGRIMAPFVRRQFGDELYGMMRELKLAFDPDGVLNPDAVLTDDDGLHLKNFKSAPRVEPEVDRCVECGYCEPSCPSKDLTVTPRQRIVVRRALQDAETAGARSLLRELRRAEAYESVDTCAVDGMCATACPVRINTGDLVRRLRTDTSGVVERTIWSAAAGLWAPLTRFAGAALSIARRLPRRVVESANGAARMALGAQVPLWSPDLPTGGSRRPRLAHAAPRAIYLPSCVGAMFAAADGSPGVQSAFPSLAAKAGVGLVTPPGLDALCCGTPWKSKGLKSTYRRVLDRTLDALSHASLNGELPVVVDNSSCAEGLRAAVAAQTGRPLAILDAIEFAAHHLLPELDVERVPGRVVVHPTCSGTIAGTNGALLELASAVVENAVVPGSWGCCAFAGDRDSSDPS